MKSLLLAIAVGYAAVAALVWLLQERLIFYPREPAPPPLAPVGWRLEEVQHVTADGTRLAGVLVVPPAERSPLVIYFGGNAEEVTSYAPEAERTYGARAVLLVNYRGYGRSGRPGEQGGRRHRALRLGRAPADIDSQRIAVHGRSLGTGVAVQVAAATGALRVLTSPTRAWSTSRGGLLVAPVALLMRHRFDSASLARRLRPRWSSWRSRQPGPPHHSRNLPPHGRQPVEPFLGGFGHNDLDVTPRYGAAIRAFLDRNL